VYERIQIPANKAVSIIVVEYDGLDETREPIPKGTDGMGGR
jgi:hypothetical protein|tara:strand:- start:1079 stop:1201 length:123 start_codon:yes stop_codon:yes gene_type:complete